MAELRAATGPAAAHRERARRPTRPSGRAGPELAIADVGTPVLRSHLVPRASFVAALDAVRDAPVVIVEAPPGYGKSTAVAQWAAREPRAVAWLTVDENSAGPASLTTGLRHAFEHAGLATRAAGSSEPDRELAALLAVVRRPPAPFVLVLDDVERVRHAALAVIRTIGRAVPAGSQLLLITRRIPQLSMQSLTGHSIVVEFGSDDLAMTVDEASGLLQAHDLALSPDEVALLVRTTGGWAAALSLAASAVSVDAEPAEAVARFGGTDPMVEDYVETEVLAVLSPPDRELLTSCSVFDRLSGPACDDVLERTDSQRDLARIARTLGPIVSRNSRAGAYQLHDLVRQVLRAQLVRTDSARARDLLVRASAWAERRGDTDVAVRLAHEAGDHDRLVRLVWHGAPTRAVSGAPHLSHWTELWHDHEIADDPVLCLVAAWAAVSRGDVAAMQRWFAFARRGPEDLVLPDGTPLRAALALLRALLGRDGLHRMVDDATLMIQLDLPDDPALGIARYVRGSAYRLLGDAGRARAQLEAAAELASGFAPTVEAHSLLQLALLADEQGGWQQVRDLVARAERALSAARSCEPAAATGAFAALAWFESRRARGGASHDAFDRAHRRLTRPEPTLPWLAVDARLLLAQSALERGDVMTAQTLGRDAERLLAAYPDAGVLPDRLTELRGAIRGGHLPLGVAASGLTTAETRVLEYLPTHLTFPEIAAGLFVSRHTVKTQAVAIYRKLGVSSRSAAVAAARELGLLDA